MFPSLKVSILTRAMLAAMLFASNGNAQVAPDRVEACWPSWPIQYDPSATGSLTKQETEKLRTQDPVGDRSVPEARDGTTNVQECYALSALAEQSAKVPVFNDDILVVRVLHQGTAVGFDALTELSIVTTVVGDEEKTRSIIATDFEAAQQSKKTFTQIKVGLKRMQAKPGDRIRVTMIAKTAGPTPIEIKSIQYFDMGARWTGYGERKTSEFSRYRASWWGVWLPVGLVGAHFKEIDDKGLTFNVTPLAVAVGTRKFVQGRYYGISLALGYTMFTSNEEEETSETTEDDDGNTTTETTISDETPFSVTGITPSIVFDFDNVAHVGFGYTLDVRTLANLDGYHGHPGFTVMLGLPIGILK